MAESEVNKEVVNLSEEEQAVLKTLIYFDVFNYPLKPSEIHQFAPISMSPLNVVPCLNFMVNHGLIFQHGSFFSIQPDSSIAESRQSSSKISDKSLNQAKRFAKFVSKVPFVEGVFAADTASFENHSKEIEWDLLIVARPHRVWLSRFFVNLFITLFWFKSSKCFGLNHVVDGGQLELPERNLYTATKVKMLIPLVNQNLYEEFVMANDWTNEFLPNLKQKSINEVHKPSSSFIKTALESIFAGSIGTKFEQNLKADHASVNGSHFYNGMAARHEKEVNESMQMRLSEFVEKHPTNLQIGA